MDYSKGTYAVKDRLFTDKLQAILYANQTLADIQWSFHKDVFNKINWKVEPSFSLDDLYEMRAQQIRDKYDYVVVCCSGGADSTNVLLSFLSNGIHVDEVIAGAPMSGLNNWEWNDTDTSPGNTISETKFALFPLLDYVKTHFPRTKITVYDYFEEMVNYDTDSWLLRSSDIIMPSSARHKYDNITHLKNLAESGKKMGIVYGIDKPTIVRRGSEIFSCIPDIPINVALQPFEEDYHNVDNVLFYYAAEMPHLVVKQSHHIMRWFSLPTNKKYMDMLVDINDPPPTQDRRLRYGTLERIMVPHIYPDTCRTFFHNVFQTKKVFTVLLSEMDNWFFKLHANTRIAQLILSDTNSFFKNINAKYFADGDQKTEFLIFSNLWKIGNMEDFIPTPNK